MTITRKPCEVWWCASLEAERCAVDTGPEKSVGKTIKWMSRTEQGQSARRGEEEHHVGLRKEAFTDVLGLGGFFFTCEKWSLIALYHVVLDAGSGFTSLDRYPMARGSSSPKPRCFCVHGC